MGKRSSTLLAIPFLLAAMACWLLLVASVPIHELLLGAGSTILTVCVSALAWREIGVHSSPTFRQVIAVWRLPWYILTGTWEMIFILARDAAGKTPGSLYRAAPFHPDEGRKGVPQIVLATAYTTVAPNFIVIGVARERLLFHQIEQSGVPRMVRDIEESR